MAEVTRRSFDLKSWQGLTLVLKVARESNLSPQAYAEFRNLVLEYAQQKGTDPKLKEKIDAIIASFDEPQKVDALVSVGKTRTHETERQGRRIVPSFMPRTVGKATTPAPEKNIAAPQQELPVSVPEQPSVAETPQSKEVVVEAPPVERPVRSVDEHRARIMEIKRRVNTLIKNPVTLVDHGNPIGREYMGALLRALKATAPGATYDLEDAMGALEEIFDRVIAYASQTQGAKEEQQIPQVPEPGETSTVAPLAEPASSAVLEEQVALPGDIPVPESVPEPIPTNPVPPPTIPKESEEVSESTPSVPTPPQPEGVSPATDEKRWTEGGGDAALDAQVRALRKQLSETEVRPSDDHQQRRSLIPSIVEIEEDPLPPRANVRGTAWDPYSPTSAPDELSTESLTQRPMSTMTGITLGTPQADLVSPEVTMALAELLHEWKVFASSGLFGMGPGGIEHPLYIKLARLPMGEVISGRFDNADMKVVHVIKDYVDAWRHEQGVAYNPTETFEHYLRRVAQRIMKRQQGGGDA